MSGSVSENWKKILNEKVFNEIPLGYDKGNLRLNLIKLEKIHEILLIEKNFFTGLQKDKNSFQSDILSQIKGNPTIIGILEEMLDGSKAIISTNLGIEYYVDICSFVDSTKMLLGDQVLLNLKNFSIVGLIENQFDPVVNLMKVEIAPTQTFNDIGGLSDQILEIKEAVELPLINPEIFLEIGVDPPKGVILFGEPGTGKTLLAKAVANSTNANFIRVTGSELVQKYLGDGPRLVREIFKIAILISPSIIFMDEIDAIGTVRFNSTSSGEKEIQRTMLELLNQLDGFDYKENLKVIMATNRIDTLDPALIRPGRIDRKIEFPFPDEKTLKKIFSVHLKKMKINDNVKIDEFLISKNSLTGADIRGICTEAALFALKNHRILVEQRDFKNAHDLVVRRGKKIKSDFLYC
jgi:26S proteasome regulatory subunit T2|mmetsp:Transcript_75391/g.110473  ORF Transcript_75391/g.110473 Transcript_75391/m.110473 type:complete len:408 (-) Transcript_75391:1340-2563(-)